MIPVILQYVGWFHLCIHLVYKRLLYLDFALLLILRMYWQFLITDTPGACFFNQLKSL